MANPAEPIVVLVEPDSRPIPAGASARFTAQLVDLHGNPLSGDAISSLTLTLADSKTGAIINSVEDQPVLNVNRGAVTEDGHVEIILTPQDTMISGNNRVWRSIILQWAWSGSSLRGRHEARFPIVPLAR